MKNVEINFDFGLIDSHLISEFEHSKQIKFPPLYKALVVKHDALYPKRNLFKFRNLFSESHGWPYKIVDGIDTRDLTFLGFGDTVSDGEKISPQSFDVYGHEHVIAFGMAANGDHVCFDYRHDPSTDEPNVVVMFHDAYDADNKMLICPVANSFEEFMDSLFKYEG